MVPAAVFWEVFSLIDYPFMLLRIVVLSMAFVPAYGLFAFSLMVLSALSSRWLGWRTPADTQMSIKTLDRPLMNWVRYMVSVHIVRLFGSVFRGTPLWTFYIRLNGAVLFNDTTRRLLNAPQQTVPGTPVAMTLGWHIGDLEGRRFFYKEGGAEGSSA
jgi:hypothetical protein